VITFLARQADKQFSHEIGIRLVRLFAEKSAQVVRNEEFEYREPRSFDFSVATVATPDLHLRFVRVRGEFSVDISPPTAPRKWEALDSALVWLDIQQGVEAKPSVSTWNYGSEWRSLDWAAIDHFLVTNWDRLKAAACLRG
jgi:hypothetical protein